MEFLSHSLEETEKLADNFLNNLEPKKEGATVVALSGDLGSGKTTFVQVCGKLFGVTGKITSPTFVIIKSYKLKLKNYKLLIHIDAYRLKNGEELNYLRFDEAVKDPHNLIFIEWPENVTEAMPKDSQKINFLFIDEKTRKIIFVDKD